jgi:hypothetical protein
MTPISVPSYPRVPRYPGVPALRAPIDDALSSISSFALLSGDIVGFLGANLFAGPQWGIFAMDGSPVAVADSVVAVDFRHETRISDYPTEQGGFASYNKVQVPYDARVRFAIGSGTLTDTAKFRRTAFLQNIERAVLSLDLYVVATPEQSYGNANLVHYDYRREAKAGINLLLVEVWLQEVRITANASFANTAAASSQAAVSGGAVQPVTTSPTPVTAPPLMPTLATSSPPPLVASAVPPNMPFFGDGSLL